MASKRRRPQPCGDCGASEKVLADGFDFLRDNPTGPKKQVPAAPPDFDPVACPIIARHWFGTVPDSSIANGHPAEVVTGLQRQRQIEHVHQLGPRAVGELLYELAEGGDLDRALAAYERLTPDLLEAVDGDRFPPVPLHEISDS